MAKNNNYTNSNNNDNPKNDNINNNDRKKYENIYKVEMNIIMPFVEI